MANRSDGRVTREGFERAQLQLCRKPGCGFWALAPEGMFLRRSLSG